MQTDFENPNTSLKDIGTNGLSGGSSSVFAWKESLNKEFYVPLKRRMIDKHGSETVDKSLENKNSIKKI